MKWTNPVSVINWNTDESQHSSYLEIKQIILEFTQTQIFTSNSLLSVSQLYPGEDKSKC